MSSKEMGIKLDAALAPRANHSAAAAAAPILASHSEISAYYSFVHLISTVGREGGRNRLQGSITFRSTYGLFPETNRAK